MYFLAFLMMLGLCTFICGVVWVACEVAARIPPKKVPKRFVDKTKPIKTASTWKPPSKPVKQTLPVQSNDAEWGVHEKALLNQLLGMVRDRDTARRLLSQAKLANPGRSIAWYLEKVIYDIERDRRC